MQVKKKKKTHKGLAVFFIVFVTAGIASIIISANIAIKAHDEEANPLVNYDSRIQQGTKVPIRVFGILLGYVNINY